MRIIISYALFTMANIFALTVCIQIHMVVVNCELFAKNLLVQAINNELINYLINNYNCDYCYNERTHGEDNSKLP